MSQRSTSKSGAIPGAKNRGLVPKFGTKIQIRRHNVAPCQTAVLKSKNEGCHAWCQNRRPGATFWHQIVKMVPMTAPSEQFL